jgi:glutathione S-transferase
VSAGGGDGAVTLVIGNRNYSSWSLRAWLFLAHSGLPFDTVRLSLDTEDFRRRIGEYSPSRRVPVLLHGPRRVWDSLAICEYVAETAGCRAWPDDDDARAFARAVSCEMHAGFAALRGELPMNCRARGRRVTPGADARRDIDRVCGIWREARDRFAAGGPWLFGDFTIADAMYAPVALRFVTYGVALEDGAQAFVDAVLADARMAEWLEAARAEPEVIGREEVG